MQRLKASVLLFWSGAFLAFSFLAILLHFVVPIRFLYLDKFPSFFFFWHPEAIVALPGEAVLGLVGAGLKNSLWILSQLREYVIYLDIAGVITALLHTWPLFLKRSRRVIAGSVLLTWLPPLVCRWSPVICRAYDNEIFITLWPLHAVSLFVAMYWLRGRLKSETFLSGIWLGLASLALPVVAVGIIEAELVESIWKPAMLILNFALPVLAITWLIWDTPKR